MGERRTKEYELLRTVGDIRKETFSRNRENRVAKDEVRKSKT